jgi:alkanesulfonate monooxygenase SsuD/methylene tetrahydromethanopterin reductase-like flavin-dependent oxidoreductase (luciferase family)
MQIGINSFAAAYDDASLAVSASDRLRNLVEQIEFADQCGLDVFGVDEHHHVNSPTVNDEIHAPMGGVRDSGWGRTGPRSLDDFSDLIWINSHSGQRQYRF